jgi:hypothetical protein
LHRVVARWTLQLRCDHRVGQITSRSMNPSISHFDVSAAT